MKDSKDIMEQIYEFIDAHRDDIIAMWGDFVNTRSFSTEKANADKMAQKLKSELEKIGCDCRFIEVGENNGPAVLGTLGAEREGAPILFTGHYDTVPLEGDFPFYIDENNNAHGLGCLDMKGGVVMSIWIVKALQSIGWQERPIKFLYVGDEEIGHDGGTSMEVILEHSRGCLCAFNMETGLVSNEICIGRKGACKAEITVHGIAAHSGNNFTDGRSAITEMMHKVGEIEALTDLEAGTTVAVTIIKGGTVFNSIPPICSCTVNMRFSARAEMMRVKEALEDICSRNTVDSTTAEMEFKELMAPYETTADVEALAGFVSSVSGKYGFGEMGTVVLGGGSDASYVTIAGTPCICSVGVRGQFNHSAEEYAQVESMFERAKLLATVVLKIEDFAAR